MYAVVSTSTSYNVMLLHDRICTTTSWFLTDEVMVLLVGNFGKNEHRKTCRRLFLE